MRVMTLKQFLQQAEEQQDNCSRILRMPLRDLIGALEEFDDYERDHECQVDVSLDSPETDTITVAFNGDAADRI
jgi:hypothetical protein